MIRNHMMAVMLSQQLLVRGLAVHPEVARLAVRMRDGEHAELLGCTAGSPWASPARASAGG